jgi:hypothetical protein
MRQTKNPPPVIAARMAFRRGSAARKTCSRWCLRGQRSRVNADLRVSWCLLSFVAVMCVVVSRASAQDLTGALIGSVKDEQGLVLTGAQVRIRSSSLIGGAATVVTNDKGQFRFAALPLGSYAVEIAVDGFAPYRADHIRIGAGETLERPVVLKLAGMTESVTVGGEASRMDARHPGFGTRFDREDLSSVPNRRASMFDPIRAAPGISPTSPSSGTVTTVSAFGSGTNENQFLIDGTNTTCPCNGVARSEPGVDFIQEVHVQSVGASAEFGNVQGAVINVITKQGSDRFLHEASYHAQTAGLTSQPVHLAVPGSSGRETGYGRARYTDVTASLGGPAVPDRLWFFAGYQYLRDHDSQPGTDPLFPRTYEQDKVFAKLTWRPAESWNLMQSFHEEFWVNPEQPTIAKPFHVTVRTIASVPAITFGHLTHTLSSNTLWDVRVGRFIYSQEGPPSSGDRGTASRLDLPSNVISGAPPQFGELTLIRTTGKATISHYQPGLLGADHQWKVGGQIERGEHHSPVVIPTGVRYIYSNGQPSQSVASAPSNTGGLFLSAAGFVSDAFTVGDDFTITAGLRFDHSQAISPDLHAVDLDGRETADIVQGLGTLYTWNLWSPRLGLTAKIGAAGRTILRASYGRFYQGVLTGEIGPFHPGATSVVTRDFIAADRDFTRIRTIVDPRTLQFDPDMRAPRTDEYAIGVDHEVGRRLSIAVAYVHKNGTDFIGWTDTAGHYREETRALADGRTVPVFALSSAAADRRFRLLNPEGYSMLYHGLVLALDRRRANGWQAFASYTLSRTSGLQSSSGTTAAGAHVSTVAPPNNLTFGRDPNDLTNATGRLPNDRPHILRAAGSIDVPKTGVTISANIGHFSGKPWAATAFVNLPQNPQQRVQLERRGARRLSAQTSVDIRVSKRIIAGGFGRIELMLDVLNALNDAAEEGLVSDLLVGERGDVNPSFGRPNVFMDPRRAMLGVRLYLGR